MRIKRRFDEGAGIIAVRTADTRDPTILTDDMAGSGVPIYAIGLTGQYKGRTSRHRIALFDGIGCALEDVRSLRYIHKGMAQPAEISSASSWVEIDLDRLVGNIAAIRRRLPAGCRYCAVIKADAYGHGIDRVAAVLSAEGVDFAAVATNKEACALRRAGFTGRVMRVRGATVAEVQAARPTGIEELATTALVAAFADAQDPISVHVPVNALAMGRDGLELTSADGRDGARAILSSQGLNIVGITTHFPSNTAEDLAESRARFLKDVEWVTTEGELDRETLLVSAASSLGLLAEAGITFDMVRSGACLWGIVGPRSDFANVMTLKSRITSVNALPAGATVGYDRTHRLTRDSRVANVSIGYANGIRREMGNRAQVAIRGQLAPVIGRVSMNALTADVTDIPQACSGDEVVLFGAQGAARVTRAMVEAASSTIMADMYSDWGRSNPRLYRGSHADPAPSLDGSANNPTRSVNTRTVTNIKEDDQR